MFKPRLTLTPINHIDWGEIVVETDTLLGRSTQPFVLQKFPEINELSRQHARIFLKDGAFYIVDLGSRNGTLLNGEAVTADPALITDGDEIALAKKLRFRALLTRESNINREKPRLISGISGSMETAEKIEDLTEDTILFSASDRFLEGFYEQEDATQLTDSLTEMDSSARQKKTREIRLALGLTLTSIIIGLIGVLYLRGSTSDLQEQLGELIQRGQFDEAYEAVNHHLRTHPDDVNMAGLWLDSFANRIVRNWLPHIHNKQFIDARQTLQEAQLAHAVRPEANAFLDLLAWLTQLEIFLYERDKQPRIQLYQDEYEIHRLLDDWNQNKRRYQSAMDDLSRRSALFQSQVNALWASLGTFLNRHALHLGVIDQLKTSISDKLKTHQGQALLHDLSDFENTHPEVAGIDRLKNDLIHYLAIEHAIHQGDLAEASRLRQSYQFQTPPFVEQATRLFEDSGIHR
jgi:hypothetical protein